MWGGRTEQLLLATGVLHTYNERYLGAGEEEELPGIVTKTFVDLLGQPERQLNVLVHWILCSSLLAAPFQEPAEVESNQAKRDRVHQWVQQLDSNQLATRQAAENALMALGPDVLEHLPALDTVDAPEVRQRLQRVTRQLQLQASRNATAASRVDLQGRMSFSSALQVLTSQTGNRFQVRQVPVVPVSVDYRQVSFWEALDGVLDQVQMNVDPYRGGRRALGLVARPAEERERRRGASYAGIFRFEPLRLEASRNLRNPRIQGLKLALQVAWEPRVTPIFMSISTSELRALDGQQKELAVDALGGAVAAAIEGEQTAIELVLPLQLPSRDVRKIARIEGSLETLMPGHAERFEFKELGQKNQVQKRAGVTVVLQHVTREDQDLIIQVKIAYDRADQAFESHRGWVFNNPAFLQPSQGQALPFRSHETVDQGARSVTLAYRFAGGAKLQEVAFVYETPTVIVRRQEKFQLSDIPLP